MRSTLALGAPVSCRLVRRAGRMPEARLECQVKLRVVDWSVVPLFTRGRDTKRE